MLHASSLKQELAALGAQTEVGFRAGEADTARIRVLAGELEAMNPTPEPARAASLLRGRWRLLYSNLELQRSTTLAQLSTGVLPPHSVEVVELYNEIDPSTGLYDNVIHVLFPDGSPGTQVMAGEYEAEDDSHIDLRYSEALVIGPGAPIRIPVNSRVGSLKTEITYLDDGFRLVRGPNGSLYILERLDPAPMRWARNL
ncbi:MAG: PAP/fibrillin family protein [Sandaracinobacteroides sp.]